MTIQKIRHKGKEIVCIDWRTRHGIHEALALLEESHEFHRTCAKQIRTLDIFQGVSGSAPFLDKARELGMETIVNKREKCAAVGIDTLNRLVHKLFGRNDGERPPLFKTVEEALDYLAAD
ncbi:MAG: hypothetical protein JXR76_03425 [Deltaproteobacteria bacterium]|nr:hypothetical protein [Deltaproteobacteria bacterium]